jgi:SPP1 gp7 family putative phage head morphogenesis protein
MSASALERRYETLRDRDEPTRTRTVRRRYAQRLRGAWQDIRTALRTGVVDRDVFGLTTEALATPPDDFAFERDADKIDAFNRWLDRQTRRDIIERFGRDNQFIRRAYEQGVRSAGTDLRRAPIDASVQDVGVVMQLPVHRDQLEALYTRNLGALEGMTDATANQMRRVLSEGLEAGVGPRDIARDLADRIDAVGVTRANTIARTEIMHSHNRARAQEFQRFGVSQVDILLAPDACPQCQALKAGAPYPADEAGGLLPRHPNCRCAVTIHTGDS